MEVVEKTQMDRSDYEARSIYETLKRKRVSDSHWWRVKKAVTTAGLPLDRDGLTQVVRLQKISPRFCFSVLEAMPTRSGIPAASDMLGSEIQHLVLTVMGITCHRTTFGKWFHKLNVGFDPKTLYSREVVALILLQALIYQKGKEKR